MIDLKDIDGIYLSAGPTDMRKGINGLLGMAQSIMKSEDMSHRLFIFCGKNKRNMKILEVDYDGYWLYQKCLVTGRFQWPKAKDGTMTIDKRQLSWLLDGLSPIQEKAHRNVLYPGNRT